MDARSQNRWNVRAALGAVQFFIRIPIAKKNGGEARVHLSPVSCDNEAALNLAAYIVAAVDDQARFDELLAEVRELLA